MKSLASLAMEGNPVTHGKKRASVEAQNRSCQRQLSSHRKLVEIVLEVSNSMRGQPLAPNDKGQRLLGGDGFNMGHPDDRAKPTGNDKTHRASSGSSPMIIGSKAQECINSR